MRQKRIETKNKHTDMDFLCPICAKGSFTLHGENCEWCNAEPTFRNIGKQFLRELWCGVTGDIMVWCHRCRRKTFISKPSCVHCNTKLPCHTTEPIKQRLQSLGLSNDPKARRMRMRVYFIISLLFFLFLLRIITHRMEIKPEMFVVSLAFIVFFMVAAACFIPRERFAVVFSGVPPIVNFCRCINFLSGMIILQATVCIWQKESKFLATQFLILWGAGFVFFGFVFPIVLGFRDLFIPRPTRFSPTDPQGKDAWKDTR